MSYDFLMMKPTVYIASADALSEDVLALQEPQTVVEALTGLRPAIAWQRTVDGGWFGSLQKGDDWYEFRIGAQPEHAWSVCTSHRASARGLVTIRADELGLIAFDG